MENIIATRKIEITLRKDKEEDIAFLKSEYSNALQNIKNICSSAVGTASEMYPLLEKLREPASIKIVDDCMLHLKRLVISYEINKADAKQLSVTISNLKNL